MSGRTLLQRLHLQFTQVAPNPRPAEGKEGRGGGQPITPCHITIISSIMRGPLLFSLLCVAAGAVVRAAEVLRPRGVPIKSKK